MNKICGIYKITSPSNRIYIGQSVDIYSRWRLYKKMKCFRQRILYYSLKKYGWNAHKKEIFECEEIKLNDMEKYYVDLFQSFNSNHGMNLRDGGGSHGKMSDESKENMRQSQIGRTHTQMSKNKIGLKHRGKILTPETKEKISKTLSKVMGGSGNGMFGKKHSPETKEKIRKKLTGKKRSIETKIKMSKNNKRILLGKKHTKETREKISLSLKGKMTGERNPFWGKHHSEETKLKMRKPKRGKLILNTINGIFYEGIKNAAESIGVDTIGLARKLIGKQKNNSPFIYA